MREIEFRGKVKWNGDHFHSGDWQYGEYFYDGEHKLNVPVYHPFLDNEILEYTSVEIDENTLGQYTGLPDKNDVKIYEGDICEFEYKDLMREENGETTFFSDRNDRKGTVIWEYGAFRFQLDNGMFIILVLADGLEVIGNIHD